MRQVRHRHGRRGQAVHGRFPPERLEARRLLSAAANVTGYHGGGANGGANLAETVLTPVDVNSTDFGKRFSTAVDGQVNAQPLYVQDVAVSRGASVGVYSVACVATEHDILFAIDANTGAVTTMPASDVGDNAGPRLGIWSTPAIDLARGELFLNAAAQEVRGTDLHFAQRVWAVRLTHGTPVVAPVVVGDTIANNPRYDFTGPHVRGRADRAGEREQQGPGDVPQPRRVGVRPRRGDDAGDRVQRPGAGRPAGAVRRISYAPRSGWAGRMVGGVFQGSNTGDFSAGVATLYGVGHASRRGVDDRDVGEHGRPPLRPLRPLRRPGREARQRRRAGPVRHRLTRRRAAWSGQS